MTEEQAKAFLLALLTPHSLSDIRLSPADYQTFEAALKAIGGSPCLAQSPVQDPAPSFKGWLGGRRIIVQ